MKESTSWKLNPKHSVLAAELIAILQALYIIQSEEQLQEFVIFTDSLVSLQLIGSPNGTCQRVVDDIRRCFYDLNNCKIVKLQWVKAHANITGNEVADRTAKLGHSNNKSLRTHLCLDEAISILGSNFRVDWEENWKYKVSATGKGKFLSKLTERIPHTFKTQNKNRRMEVVLSRLRMGHIGVMTYLYQFGMEQDDRC